MKTKKISDSTKAKIVFGEATLKDFWPMVKGKFDLLYLTVDYNPTYYPNFSFDEEEGLAVYSDEHCDSTVFELHPDTKVKLSDGGIEFVEEDGEEGEILFFKATPMKVSFL